jgi:hypothetical protein
VLPLDALTEKGAVVRTASSHYSRGWKEKFGLAERPMAFFSAGYLAGAFAAVYNRPLAEVRARQTQCMSMGAAEDVFEVEAGESNFARYAPRKTAAILPVNNDPEPDSPVDRHGIPRAVLTLPLVGDAKGLIWNFGLYLTRMYADYYNRISFEFERAMIEQAGTHGVEVSRGLFIEAGHVCAFNTLGGVMVSPEWDGLIKPSLRSREDWVHGIVAVMNAFGWGVWKVLDLSPERAVFRIYNDYESLGYQSMYGRAEHPIAYLATGGAAGIMNLVYLGDIASKPALTEQFYNGLFKGGRAYTAKMTACQAQGAPYTEIEAFRP